MIGRKDKSTFDSMFSLDLDLRSHTSSQDMSVGPEGESDDNPIRLQGDTADEFRALLWALYSMYVRFDYLVFFVSHNYPGLMN
jgi:hypothetical protein